METKINKKALYLSYSHTVLLRIALKHKISDETEFLSIIKEYNNKENNKIDSKFHEDNLKEYKKIYEILQQYTNQMYL